MLIISKDKNDLAALVNQQLMNMFMCSKKVDPFLEHALERLEKCFSYSSDKYYHRDGETYFSPYHSGQYSIFLYFLANSVWKIRGDNELSTVLYYLNKMMNNVEWYYEYELPDVFGVEHPLGTVMGRASYSDHFYFYQGCTVGGIQRHQGSVYPILGEFVTLCANSSILGDCHIGNNVVVGAGAMIKNQDVPNNCVVFGSSPNLIFKCKTENEMKDLYRDKWQIMDNNGEKI